MTDHLILEAGKALSRAGYRLQRCGPNSSRLPLAEVLAAVRPLIEAEVRQQVADELQELRSVATVTDRWDVGYVNGLGVSIRTVRGGPA